MTSLMPQRPQTQPYGELNDTRGGERTSRSASYQRFEDVITSTSHETAEPSARPGAAGNPREFARLWHHPPCGGMSMRSSTFARALKGFFGSRWYFSVLGILVVAHLPVLVFWNRLSFSPERFTEEWLKGWWQAFIILMAIEIVRFVHDVETEQQRASRWLLETLLEPAKALLRLLRRYPDATQMTLDHRIAVGNQAKGMFDRLSKGISLSLPPHLPENAYDTTLGAIETVSLESSKAHFVELFAAGRYAPEHNPESHAVLTGRIAEFVTHMQHTYNQMSDAN